MGASSAEWRGVRYAFGRGLDPRQKDGVRAHPLVFACGTLLHLGVFSAAARLLGLLLGIEFPAFANVLLASALIAGLLCGCALIVRRLRSPVLRVVSGADDYISAALVLGFLGAAEATMIAPGATAAFYGTTLALAGYAPFGKIRHCVLFFITRTYYGIFVGRRGVLGATPPGTR